MSDPLIKLGNYLLQHQNGIDASWTAKVIEEERQRYESLQTQLDDHLQHVQQFLNDMYATMIDPVEQPEMKVSEMCALLLKTATEQREQAGAIPEGQSTTLEQIASQYHLPGPTNFREALKRAYDAGMAAQSSMAPQSQPEATSCKKCGKPRFTPQTTIASGMAGSIATYFCMCDINTEWAIGREDAGSLAERQQPSKLHNEGSSPSSPSIIPAPSVNREMLKAQLTYPIQLNVEQEKCVKIWAADDRCWTTQETVEFNLRTFARKILAEAIEHAEAEGSTKP